MLRNKRWHRRWSVVAVASAIALSSVLATAEPAPRAAQTDLPNILLFVTDDQRADTLRYMANVLRLLGGHGVTFNAGYVVNPVCCPSRASMLTGDLSHTTMVYTNHPQRPFGGFPAFDDDETIATTLDDAGYHTGLFGKYLNGYHTEYIPPGWDRWFATFRGGGYFDYQASSDGSLIGFGHDRSDYGTTVLRNQVLAFIRNTDASTPFFAYVAPHAPHRPATPAARDRRLYSSLPPHRGPSYDEVNTSDKPEHIETQSRIDGATSREIDDFRLNQLRSLQSVDRALASIIDALHETGRLENTMIVFTSDNGMLWGEHRLYGKSEVYEEAIRVPFVVRYDALIDRARSDDHLALNIDLAPTFADIAGLDLQADGRSLVPLLADPNAGWRRAFLVEHLLTGNSRRVAPTFCAVHTDRYVFVRYGTHEEELYDLARDPYELDNRVDLPRYAGRRRALLSKLRTLCDPVPPGFSF